MADETSPKKPRVEEEYFPEAWYIPDEVEDQKAENRLDPNLPVTKDQLLDMGVLYWKLDPSKDTYPVKAIPWDPKEAGDPDLIQIRDERGYSYADVITVHPDHLPGFDEKVKAFFEEHIHDAEEVRFIIAGSGYFDLRDFEDKWVRIHVKSGDLITVPEGIYHRFTCDTGDFIHAMRLFKGNPVWTPFNRPQDDHPSRQYYVDNFLSKHISPSEEVQA